MRLAPSRGGHYSQETLQRANVVPPQSSGPDPSIHRSRNGQLMLPSKQGLYDPRFEHDACGVSFVADLHGRASHRMVELGLQSLCHLDHRGATNAEVNVGDGAGILIQVPDRFLREVSDVDLPPAGSYATGIGFLPRDPEGEASARKGVE